MSAYSVMENIMDIFILLWTGKFANM